MTITYNASIDDYTSIPIRSRTVIMLPCTSIINTTHYRTATQILSNCHGNHTDDTRMTV